MNELEQGIAALKAGQRDEARKLLAQAIRREPNNERAWLWMFNAANNDKERIQCLERVLQINPMNEKAAQMLKQMSGSKIEPEPLQVSNLQTAPTHQDVNKNKNTLIGCLAIIGSITVICLALFFCTTLFNQSTPTQPISLTATTDYIPIQQPVVLPNYPFKYVIRGTAKTASITYDNAQGGTEQMDVTVPFAKAFTINSTFYASIIAQNRDDTAGTITCEIWFNGEKIKTSTSTAQYGIVTCSGFINP